MSETKVVAGERNKVVAAVASSNGRHKSFQKEVLNPSFFFFSYLSIDLNLHTLPRPSVTCGKCPARVNDSLHSYRKEINKVKQCIRE